MSMYKIDPPGGKAIGEAFGRFSKVTRVAAVLSIAGLGICLTVHYSTIVIDWARTKEFVETLKNAVEIAAVLGGGLWAYFKFVKGRTFQESLTPQISGKFVLIDGATYLIVSTGVKNVGSSRIVFSAAASALIVFEYQPSSQPDIHTVADKRLTSFDVFSLNDQYVEPNEILEEQRLIAIPTSPKLGLRLELEVMSASGFTWRASTIVDKSSLDGNIYSGVGRL
jgi:hypothetical protein